LTISAISRLRALSGTLAAAFTIIFATIDIFKTTTLFQTPLLAPVPFASQNELIAHMLWFAIACHLMAPVAMLAAARKEFGHQYRLWQPCMGSFQFVLLQGIGWYDGFLRTNYSQSVHRHFF
jgi:hypothetical protein